MASDALQKAALHRAPGIALRSLGIFRQLSRPAAVVHCWAEADLRRKACQDEIVELRSAGIGSENDPCDGQAVAATSLEYSDPKLPSKKTQSRRTTPPSRSRIQRARSGRGRPSEEGRITSPAARATNRAAFSGLVQSSAYEIARLGERASVRRAIHAPRVFQGDRSRT